MSGATTRKTVLLTAASAIGVFVLTLDRSPSQAGLFDPDNWTKAGLKAVFGRALQRRLSIDGELDIDLGSTLRIVAHDIAVQNVDWAEQPHMLRVGRLTVAIDLVQLATGDIVIPEVRLDEPVVFVERSRDGEVNWQTVLAGEVIEDPPAVEEEAAEEGGSAIPSVEELVIQGARVQYVDRMADLQIETRLDRLTGSTGSADQPARLTGSGEVAGLPLELDLAAGSLDAPADRRSVPVDASIRIGETRLTLDGEAADLLALEGLDLRTRLSSEDPAELLRVADLEPVGELPALAWSGRIERTGDAWGVQELEARIGDSVLAGSGRFVPAGGGAAPLIEADLQAERLVTDDFDDLLQLARGSEPTGTSRPPAAPEEAGPPTADDLRLPRFDLSVRVDEVSGPVLALEQLRLEASRQEGAPTFDLQARGRYQGAPLAVDLRAGGEGPAEYPLEGDLRLAGTRVQVTGTIEEPMALDGLKLRFDAQSERPAALLRLAGIEQQPELPPVALAGRLSHEKQVWRLRELDLSVGESDLAGRAMVDLAGERPALRAKLTAERLVQAEIEQVLAAAGAFGGTDVAGKEQPADADDGPELVSFDGANPELNPEALPDLDADLTLVVERFEGPEITLEDVRMAAELHDRLPRLALQAEGSLRGEPLEVMARLGAGESTGQDNRYPISIALDAPASRLTVDGTVDEPIPLRGVDLAVELRSAAPAAWLDLAGLGEVGLNRVLGSAHLTQEGARWRLADLYAEVNQSNLFGELVVDLSEDVPRIEGELTSNRLVVDDFVPADDAPAAPLAADEEPVIEGAGLEPQVLPAVEADLSVTIEYLQAEQGRLDNLSLDLALKDRLPAIDLVAEGRLQREPVRVTLQAGAPAGEAGPVEPYPVKLEVLGRETRVRAEGTVAEPLVLDGLDVDVQLEGPTLDRLGEIAQLALPATPPYRLTSNLAREGKRWTLTGLDGQIGDSDLAGDVAVDLGTERPTLFATLRSSTLDFDDLGPLVGVAPEARGDEAASERQERRAARQAADRWVLPDDPIDLSELRSMDARVTFEGERVIAPNLPLEHVAIELSLEDGRLRLEPVRLEMVDGALTAEIALDARDKPLDARFDIVLKNLKLNQFLKQFEVEFADLEVEREGRGTLHGRATIETRGNTVHEMAGAADGRVTVLMDGGRINALILEAAGLDVGEILAVLLGGEPGPDMVPLECFIGNFRIEDGVMRPRPLVLKAPNDTILGTGSIDLGREMLDLALEAEPSDTSVLSASSPIRIEGPWTSPSIIPTTDELVAKGVAAVGLGIVIPIVGAVIPFVEIGEEAGSGCGRLLADARSEQP